VSVILFMNDYTSDLKRSMSTQNSYTNAIDQVNQDVQINNFTIHKLGSLQSPKLERNKPK